MIRLTCFLCVVSMCLPSDALLQHLPSYLGFSYLGRGVSLYGCSSKSQPLLLPLDEGYLLTTTLPDLQHGIAPLGPPVPVQPSLLRCVLAPPSHHPWPRLRVYSSQPPPLVWGTVWLLPAATPSLGHRVAPLGRSPRPRTWGSSSCRRH